MSVFNLIKYLSSEIVTQGAMQILQFCYEIISFINRNIQQIHGLLSSVIKAFHYVFYILQPALLNAFFYGFLQNLFFVILVKEHTLFILSIFQLYCHFLHLHNCSSGISIFHRMCVKGSSGSSLDQTILILFSSSIIL